MALGPENDRDWLALSSVWVPAPAAVPSVRLATEPAVLSVTV